MCLLSTGVWHQMQSVLTAHKSASEAPQVHGTNDRLCVESVLPFEKALNPEVKADAFT